MEIDPYHADENQALSWLKERFEADASYGTINNCRAALGLLLGESISQGSAITRFLRGVFRLRPSKPKYEDTWDVTPVLETVAALFPLESISLSQLTSRLVILLALATGQRMQTLAAIKLDNIEENVNGFIVRIDTLIKTSRPGRCQPLLTLPKISEKPELCVASTLREYLKVTKPLRGNITSLILTTRKPYKPATTQSISRWIRAVLATSGINNKFKAHSTRHAVTSAALKNGVDLNLIKRTAGWSKKSQTFAKFYNRPIVEARGSFAESVLLKH